MAECWMLDEMQKKRWTGGWTRGRKKLGSGMWGERLEGEEEILSRLACLACLAAWERFQSLACRGLTT